MSETRANPRTLSSTDILHVVVLGILILLSPLAILRTSANLWLPVGYALGGAAIVGLAALQRARPADDVIRWARLLYPFVAVLLIFWSLYWMVPAVGGEILRDDVLMEWDRAILGFDPVARVRGMESPLLTDILHIVYISYFFLPLLLFLSLLPVERRRELHESIFIVCLSFYLCYAGYLLVPAEGPRYHVYGSNVMEGWIVTQPLRDVINFLEPNKADVFPSAHTAATLVITGLALRFVRRLGYLLVPLSLGILASLVYTRYHYFIDILAGILWAAVTLTLGPFLHRLWESRDDEPAEAA